MMKQNPIVAIECLTLGSMGANCYIVMDVASRDTIIIDPGDEAEYITQVITRMDAKPIAIMATHGHFDHIMAYAGLQMVYEIPFYIHADDIFLVKRMQETARHFLGHDVVDLPPQYIRTIDEESYTVGKSEMQVVHTSGHTPGSVCFVLAKNHCIFTGDTLFAMGSIGRTDFSYSDGAKMKQSLDTLFSYPDNYLVYSGHGEATIIGDEKQIHKNGFDVSGLLP